MPACTGLWALLPVPVAQPVLTLDESSLPRAQDLSLVATATPPQRRLLLGLPSPTCGHHWLSGVDGVNWKSLGLSWKRNLENS